MPDTAIPCISRMQGNDLIADPCTEQAWFVSHIFSELKVNAIAAAIGVYAYT